MSNRTAPIDGSPHLTKYFYWLGRMIWRIDNPARNTRFRVNPTPRTAGSVRIDGAAFYPNMLVIRKTFVHAISSAWCGPEQSGCRMVKWDRNIAAAASRSAVLVFSVDVVLGRARLGSALAIMAARRDAVAEMACDD